MVLAGMFLNIIGFLAVLPEHGFLGVVIVAAGGALMGMGVVTLLHETHRSPVKGAVEDRLRTLKRLYDEELITEEEYADKRKDILAEKW